MTFHNTLKEVIFFWTIATRSDLWCFEKTLFEILNVLLCRLNHFYVMFWVKPCCRAWWPCGCAIYSFSIDVSVVELWSDMDRVHHIQLLVLTFIDRSSSSRMDGLKMRASLQAIFCPILGRHRSLFVFLFKSGLFRLLLNALFLAIESNLEFIYVFLVLTRKLDALTF